MRRLPLLAAQLNFRFYALLASLVLALALGGVAQAGESAPVGEGPVERLEIVTASGSHVFEAEMARTSEQRMQGLMYRQSMPENHAMLFDFQVEDKVMMWMRNTYMSLDMVFVSHKGRVVWVAVDAEPLSERIIASPRPAYAVIELNAGAARAIGLKVGDRVVHPIFRP